MSAEASTRWAEYKNVICDMTTFYSSTHVNYPLHRKIPFASNGHVYIFGNAFRLLPCDDVAACDILRALSFHFQLANLFCNTPCLLGLFCKIRTSHDTAHRAYFFLMSTHPNVLSASRCLPYFTGYYAGNKTFAKCRATSALIHSLTNVYPSVWQPSYLATNEDDPTLHEKIKQVTTLPCATQTSA